MKIKSVKGVNFAEYDNVKVSFDDNVNYLIGKNGSGKTTLGLTLIWFVLQGIAEKAMAGTQPIIGERFRFIGPNGSTAKGEIVLHDEQHNFDVKVVRKLTKAGTELTITGPKDVTLDQKWLNDLFNVFLLAPRRFMMLTPQEQAKALGIDTSTYDRYIANIKNDYTLLNRELKNMGEIEDVDPVETVDISALLGKKSELKNKVDNQYMANVKANNEKRQAYELDIQNAKKAIDEYNHEQNRRSNAIQEAVEAHNILKGYGYEGKEVEQFIWTFENPQPALAYGAGQSDFWPTFPEFIQPEMPVSDELIAIDQQIATAAETNVKAHGYVEYLKKIDKKIAKEEEIENNRKDLEKRENERLEYIKKFKFPFKGLVVGEEGELLLNDKLIKEPYYSSGELLKIIPKLIASQKPELKYVFLQDFNLLDEDMQADVIKDLTSRGFQLVLEMVGKKVITGKNCILLQDNVVIESNIADNAFSNNDGEGEDVL